MVTEANNKYNVALGKAEYGLKEDTVIKNNLRAALIVILKQLADYVQTISKGNEAIILSSGFDVNKKPSTIGILDKPENFAIKPGKNKGSINTSCDRIEGSSVYETDYTEVPVTSASIWRVHTSTKSSSDVDGLKSGVEYAFRICGIGSNPTRVWSDIITSFVL